MNRLALIMVALLAAAAATAADEEWVLARIIDTSIKRVPVHTVAPKYPRKARRDRVEGKVRVCFEVDRQGRPRRVGVRHSSARTFERPSIKAVRASTFKPLGENEPLLAIKSCRTFIFALEPSEPLKP